MHRTRLLPGLLLAIGILVSGSTAVGQDALEPIVVIEVGGPLDQRALDFVLEAIGDNDAHAYILKIDSPGVSSADDLARVYQGIASARAPVISWIGPDPAVAFGGAAYLANHADVRSAAPGAEVGYLEPAVVRSGASSPSARPGDDTEAFRRTEQALEHATETVTVESPVIDGFVDRADPALGQLIVSLDGLVVDRGDQTFTLSTATTRSIGDETVVVASRPVKFIKDSLLDQFLRLGSRPEAAFLFLVFALTFAVFEFYTAGAGMMAVVASLALIPAGYGLATLPMWWPAVGLTVGGLAFLVWGFVQNRIDWRAWLGGVALVMGGVLFTATRPMYPPALWMVLLASVTAGVFIWYTLTTVVRGRFATPTVGREELLGHRCVVVDDLDPIGVVMLDTARWRASVDRGVVVEAGVPVEIVGITGLLLDVEPVTAAPGSPRS
ncbi:MAG: hypothetical protein KDB69_01635 [Acidimicrobiia bacterium]|nr:hypothetical protein [Acidimicrobiia bacterium]